MPARLPTTGRLCAFLALLALVLAQAAPAATPTGFTAPDDPAVPALIKSLQGCFKALTPADRQLLTLRAGLGGRAPQLTARIAATLKGTPAATNAAELTAIRRLEGQRRAGTCKPQAAKTAKKPAQAKTAAPATTQPATTTATADSSIGAFGVIVPVLLLAAFGAGISLELRRQRQPPGQSLR